MYIQHRATVESALLLPLSSLCLFLKISYFWGVHTVTKAKDKAPVGLLDSHPGLTGGSGDVMVSMGWASSTSFFVP